MSIIEQALQKVTDLQSKYKENQKHFWIAEQIKDICRESEDNAQHILNDIDDDKMSIAAVEKQIEAYARKNGGCCPPQPADRIIREFFGLGTAQKPEPKADDGLINLEDFM